MFDTHCHLDSLSSSVSLSKTPLPNYPLLAVSTQEHDWTSLLELSLKHPNIIPTLGIHPWFIDTVSEQWFTSLSEFLIQFPKAQMGEIGLDSSSKYKSSLPLQMSVLSKQLELASQLDRAVSIHVVKAHNELIALLKETPVKGVIHGLGSSLQVAQQYVDLGFRLGVNAVVLRDNARRYHELVKYFGLDYLVLETDYPNVKPPGSEITALADIHLVADRVAQILNRPVETVIAKTDYNARQIFLRTPQ